MIGDVLLARPTGAALGPKWPSRTLRPAGKRSLFTVRPDILSQLRPRSVSCELVDQPAGLYRRLGRAVLYLARENVKGESCFS